MAATKTEGPKTHTLTLTNAGAYLLREMLTQPNWYEGKGMPVAVSAVGVIENLSDHVPPSGVDDKTTETWENKSKTVTVSERQRDACKECVRFMLSKGALRLSAHVGKLIAELGLNA